jgi:hypothetical protein
MNPHVCQGSWMRINRMLLALFDSRDDALSEVVAELGDCHHCWKNLAMQLVSMVANEQALRAGSLENAAAMMREAMARELMFNE